MLIQHSQQIVLHRMVRTQAQSLEAGQALIAKYSGEMMIRQAIENSDAPQPVTQYLSGLIDRTA